MKTHISCSDKIEIKKSSDKSRRVEVFRVEVEDDEYEDSDELRIRFWDSSFMSITTVPVKYWAELKDTTDKLIIKAEHLKKEDC